MSELWKILMKFGGKGKYVCFGVWELSPKSNDGVWEVIGVFSLQLVFYGCAKITKLQ